MTQPTHSKKPLCFLVSGTGTDIGKTWFLAALCRSLLRLGLSTQAVKIVQTGFSQVNQDMGDAAIYSLACQDLPNFVPPKVLHCFPLAASPHLAAARVGQSLSVKDLTCEILKWQTKMQGKCEVLLFETAGGLCVPLNNQEDMLDLAKKLSFPVLLVAKNHLGAINHTLLSLKALAQAKLPLLALLLNELDSSAEPTEQAIRQDNQVLLAERLKNLYPDALFQTLPFCYEEPLQALAKLASALRPLATQILSLKARPTPRPCQEDLVSRDRACLWHPYSSLPNTAHLYAVRETYQNRLLLADG
ncbi:MAG: dethiobiotin synthase, partial [Desulfovibrio sp.]|nr:dethiobiotin synthase [Desulfovibrio sp.]